MSILEQIERLAKAKVPTTGTVVSVRATQIDVATIQGTKTITRPTWAVEPGSRIRLSDDGNQATGRLGRGSVPSYIV